MSINPKVLNDIKLAIKNALPETHVGYDYIVSHKDILDCLKNINTESYNYVCNYIDYHGGLYIPIKWFQLLEQMKREISSESKS